MYLQQKWNRLECYLLDIPPPCPNTRLTLHDLQQNQLICFDKMILYPELGLPFLKEELTNTIYLQAATIIIATIYLAYPLHIQQLYSLDLLFTILLHFLVLMTLVSLFCKVLLLQKVQKQSMQPSGNNASRFLILLFMCRLYQFNIQLSRFSNLFYFLLTFRTWQLKQRTFITHTVSLHLNTAFIFVLLFYIRIVLSQVKY